MISEGLVALFRPEILVGDGEQISEAVRVYAGYLVSRNVAIGAKLLGTLVCARDGRSPL